MQIALLRGALAFTLQTIAAMITARPLDPFAVCCFHWDHGQHMKVSAGVRFQDHLFG
jgi:hypothetical protein